MHVLAQLGAGAQPRVRPDPARRPDLCFLDVAERLHARAGANGGIPDHAMRADVHAIVQMHAAFEHAAHVDGHIASARELAAHIDARGVRQRHAGLEQALCEVALVNALHLGQLDLAVDAQRLPQGRRLGGDDLHALVGGALDGVREVVLTLRVVVAQRGKPAAQVAGRADDDAGVDLADGADLVAGILLFDDAHDVAGGVTYDAPVSGRIGHLDGQHAQALGAGCMDQGLERGGGGQRHVAVEHQRGLAVIEQRQRLHHGVAGAKLLGLLGERHVRRAHRLAHMLRAVADHHDEARRRQGAGGVEHMGEHRPPGNRVQDLGQGGIHPFSHPCGKNDDIHKEVPK
ncbi:hypothetical protein D3C81_1319180 [compost metagenome]